MMTVPIQWGNKSQSKKIHSLPNYLLTWRMPMQTIHSRRLDCSCKTKSRRRSRVAGCMLRAYTIVDWVTEMICASKRLRICHGEEKRKSIQLCSFYISRTESDSFPLREGELFGCGRDEAVASPGSSFSSKNCSCMSLAISDWTSRVLPNATAHFFDHTEDDRSSLSQKTRPIRGGRQFLESVL